MSLARNDSHGFQVFRISPTAPNPGKDGEDGWQRVWVLPSYFDAQRNSDAGRYSRCSFSILQHMLAAAAPLKALWYLRLPEWKPSSLESQGSAGGTGQRRAVGCGVPELYSSSLGEWYSSWKSSALWSLQSPQPTELGGFLLHGSCYPDMDRASQHSSSGGAGWGEQSDRGWDEKVAQFRGRGA